MTAAAIAALLVRYGMVLLFLPFSALDKVAGFGGAVKQAEEVFRPRAPSPLRSCWPASQSKSFARWAS